MSHATAPSAVRQHLAVVVRELAVPAPFELSGFPSCLERRTGRPVELVPVVMTAGGPSGVRLRTARADYFYYEQQTSAFHQAHIVLSLAAPMLLGDDSGRSVDRVLVPDVSAQLVALMLGDAGSRPVTRREAETFAFLVLDRARLRYPPLVALRFLRQLMLLQLALREAVPEVVAGAIDGLRPGARFQLYQQVIEIRDAALVLRSYRDPDVALAAGRTGRAAGLSGDRLTAAVEAAVLAHALRAREAGESATSAAGDTPWGLLGCADLRREAVWLVKVARAFGRSRQRQEFARATAREHRAGGWP